MLDIYYLISENRIWSTKDAKFVTEVPDDIVLQSIMENGELASTSALINFLKADGCPLGELTPVEELIPIKIAEYEKKVQDRLDNFAKTKTYDNILSACTYANDDVPEFKIEGQYCTKMRSITWKAAQTFLNESIADVMAGLRDIPTWEEVESNLPVLEWPEGSRN